MYCKNSSIDNEESFFLRKGVSRAISRLSIIINLKPLLLSVDKIEKASEDGE